MRCVSSDETHYCGQRMSAEQIRYNRNIDGFNGSTSERFFCYLFIPQTNLFYLFNGDGFFLSSTFSSALSSGVDNDILFVAIVSHKRACYIRVDYASVVAIINYLNFQIFLPARTYRSNEFWPLLLNNFYTFIDGVWRPPFSKPIILLASFIINHHLLRE